MPFTICSLLYLIYRGNCVRQFNVAALKQLVEYLVTFSNIKNKLYFFFLPIFASDLQRRTSMWFNLNGPNKLSYVNLLRFIIRTIMITSIS